MEVCGGHTHAIFRFGLKDLLPPNVELIHGPGCPVCVLPMGRIDDGLDLAGDPNVIFTAFGDMMRVPGSKGSPLESKARGADVRIVYSPLDALKIAQANPDRARSYSSPSASKPRPRRPRLTLKRAKAQGVTNFVGVLQPRHDHSGDSGPPRFARHAAGCVSSARDMSRP